MAILFLGAHFWLTDSCRTLQITFVYLFTVSSPPPPLHTPLSLSLSLSLPLYIIFQRKKVVQQQGGVASVTTTETKGSQDNIVKLRKRNADLMTLTKKLDERCTALKLENEQLVRQCIAVVAMLTIE